MSTLQMQIDFNDFNPFRPDSLNINRPTSTETQCPQNSAFQIVTLFIWLGITGYSSHIFTHSIKYCRPQNNLFYTVKQAGCSEKVSSTIETLENLFEDLDKKLPGDFVLLSQ
jgi:hypothetical protein